LSRPAITPPPNLDTEEYAVLSALVRQNPIGYNLGDSFIVKEETASDLYIFERTLENVPKQPDPLVDSYRARNTTSFALSPNLDVEQAYTMMSQEEFDQVFRRKGPVWTRFQEKYPEAGGLITFSRPGFNVQGDKALADIDFRCGDLCGAGGLYLLVKQDGNWVVQDTLMVWQS
jgi:hypothetical protein